MHLAFVVGKHSSDFLSFIILQTFPSLVLIVCAWDALGNICLLLAGQDE